MNSAFWSSAGMVISAMVAVNSVSVAVEISQQQRAQLLELVARPQIKTAQMEVVINTLEPDAKRPSEEEIRKEIDKDYERVLTEVRQQVAEGYTFNTTESDLRATLEQQTRKKIADRFDRTLHERVYSQNNQYVLQINRDIDLAHLPEKYGETYINAGDTAAGDFTHYAIEGETKTARIESDQTRFKEYDYTHVGLPANPLLLSILQSPEERNRLISAGYLPGVLDAEASASALYEVVVENRVAWEGKVVDVYAFTRREDGKVTEFFMDSDDYRKLYLERAYQDPSAPDYEFRYDDYRQVDSLETIFPYYIRTMNLLDADPASGAVQTINVLRATFNEVIPSNVFELETYVEPDMTVVDARQDPPVIVESKGSIAKKSIENLDLDSVFASKQSSPAAVPEKSVPVESEDKTAKQDSNASPVRLSEWVSWRLCAILGLVAAGAGAVFYRPRKK